MPDLDSFTKIEEASKRYWKSEKGKTVKQKYFQSEKGQTAQKKYLQSEKGKAAVLRYFLSEKGQSIRTRQKAVSSLLIQYNKFLKDNPEKTMEDFLGTNKEN